MSEKLEEKISDLGREELEVAISQFKKQVILHRRLMHYYERQAEAIKNLLTTDEQGANHED